MLLNLTYKKVISFQEEALKFGIAYLVKCAGYQNAIVK